LLAAQVDRGELPRQVAAQERGAATVFWSAGSFVGPAIGAIVVAALTSAWGWRAAFYWCGLLGVFVALGWYFLATDRPNEHPRVNQAELELIGRDGSIPSRIRNAPWGRIFTNRSIIALVFGYFCQGFPIYFFHTWLFLYLVRVRGFSLTEGGFYGAIPYVAIALASPLGGLFSDFAVRKFGKPFGQRLAVWVGMSCSAILLWEGAHAGNKVTAILLLAAAAGSNMFASVTFWAASIDLGEEYAGSVAGLMNTLGNLGGWLSPIVTAYMASKWGWTSALTLASVITAASGLCWLGVDTTRGIGNETENR